LRVRPNPAWSLFVSARSYHPYWLGDRKKSWHLVGELYPTRVREVFLQPEAPPAVQWFCDSLLGLILAKAKVLSFHSFSTLTTTVSRFISQ